MQDASYKYDAPQDITLVPWQTIVEAVCAAYGIHPSLVTQSGPRTKTAQHAKACICVVARKYGHSISTIRIRTNTRSELITRTLARWEKADDIKAPFREAKVKEAVAYIDKQQAIFEKQRKDIERRAMQNSYSGGLSVADRDQKVKRLKKEFGWTVTSIAKHLDLHPETVCIILGMELAWAKK